MEGSQILKKQSILEHLTSLPQKVLSLHGTEYLTDLVMHELCSVNCFDLQKAAYLVDNPDFDCLKGVAGFCTSKPINHNTVWETPELFQEFLRTDKFNQQVRSILHPSSKRSHKSDQQTTQLIAQQLGLLQPVFCTWPMKHENQGILIYEANAHSAQWPEVIRNGACLLGFCPVY